MNTVDTMMNYCFEYETDFIEHAYEFCKNGIEKSKKVQVEFLKEQVEEYKLIQVRWQTCYHLAIELGEPQEEVLKIANELDRIQNNLENLKNDFFKTLVEIRKK